MQARQLAGRLFQRVIDPAPRSESLPPHHPVNSLTTFKQQLYSRYQHAAHLAALDEKLQAVSRYVETGGAEGIGRLIIEMPPRHGKTVTTSRLYPVWHLGRNPHHHIILASYGQSLADKNSRIARNYVKSAKYQAVFPKTVLARDSQSVREWTIEGTNGEGGVDAVGIGGPATGKGAHLLIVDDPIKNRAEAESQTYRDKIYDSFTDDLYTRLEPGGAVIIMATRWHEDDLTGRVLKHFGEKWDVLSLPALALEGDVLGRAVGDPLWPERFPLAVLVDIQATLGDYSWSALYQQSPKPAEGNIFKRVWYTPCVRVMPPVVKSVRYWDLAMSEKTSADYTVGLRMDLGRDGEFYISDVARAQVELHNLAKFIKDVILSDGVNVKQGFENKGYMTRAIKQLAKDPELAQYIIKGYPAEQDKLTRALPFAGHSSLGVVHLIEQPNADVFIEELTMFPNGTHDDQVDAAAGAWAMINEVDKKRKLEARTQSYA